MSRAVLVCFAVALAFRLGWILGQGSPSPDVGLVFPDERAYWQVAESIAAGHGLVDEFGYRATYMPLYPAFLSLFVGAKHGLLFARLAQGLIGAAVVFPIAAIGRYIGSPRVGVVAAALAAIDPFLVFGFSHRLLTETIFTTLLATGIAVGWPPAVAESRRWWLRGLLCGAVFAAAIYTRPSVTGFVILWGLAAIMLGPRRPFQAMAAVCAAVVVVLSLMPWAVRNDRVIGACRSLTTRGGISLYDGVGPHATGASDLAYTKTMPAVQSMSETQWDAYFDREARRAIHDDPARFARLAWAKFRRTWSFVPNEPTSRTPMRMAVSAAWMVVVLATAGVGAVRLRRRRPIVLLLLAAIYFTLLHMVYVGSVRYRVPAMPPIYVLSAAVLGVRRRAAPDERLPAEAPDASR